MFDKIIEENNIMKRYIKSSEVDFTEIYHNAYNLYVETENSYEVMQYLDSVLDHDDAVCMLHDIKDTYNI